MSQDIIGFDFEVEVETEVTEQGDTTPTPATSNPNPKVITFPVSRPKKLWVDWDALKAIPLEDVCASYGGELDTQTNQYRLPGESKGKLSIKTEENVFYHFATGVGGGAIQLLHLLKAPDTNACDLPTQEERMALAQELAARFGCLKDLAHFRERQVGMAAPLHLTSDPRNHRDHVDKFLLALRGERGPKGPGDVPALDTYHRHLKAWAKPEEVEERINRAARARIEAQAYLQAVEIPLPQVTLAWAQNAVCICPSAPRFGADIAFDGWGKEQVSAAIARDGSNLYVLDFDGISEDKEKGIEGKKPLVTLVHRLALEMRAAGAHPRVMELTSIDAQDTERSKVHLSFLGSRKVKTVQEYRTNHETLSSLAQEIVESWDDVSAEEKAALIPDPCMGATGHLKRLAGTSKEGRQSAVIVFQVWGDKPTYIDFVALAETRGSTITLGDVTYYYGRTVKKVTVTEEMPKLTAAERKALTEAPQPIREESVHLIAKGVYPLRVELPLSDGDEGEAKGATVYCRYHRGDGTVAYWRWPLGVSHNAHKRSEETSKWASRLLQIQDDKGRDLASALDLWGSHQKTLYTALTQEGWQVVKGQRTYVSGSQVIGAETGVVSQSASNRGYVGGTFEGQKETIAKHVTTPTSLFALGVSLSGMVLDYLGSANNFGFHLVGSSSSGKTTTARLCASVYGYPSASPTRSEGVEVAPAIQGWNTTANALENTAESYRDAALVMDEIKSADKYVVASIIHTYASGAGKSRMRKDGAARKVKFWQGVMVSTGEVSIAQKLGDLYQGGESVRLIDIPVVPGDLTQSADQANALREALLTHYGHASLRMAAHLLTLDHSTIQTRYAAILKEVRASIGTAAELQRIAEPVATSILALDLAREAGILAHEDTIWTTLRGQIVKTISAKIASTRSGADTPEERAHKRLREIYAAEPGRIPVFGDKVPGHTQILGYRLPLGRHDAWEDWRAVQVYTTSAMLSAQEETGGIFAAAATTAAKYRDFLRAKGWLRETPHKNKKVCGHEAKWIGIVFEDADREDDDGAEESAGYEGIPPIEMLESLMGEIKPQSPKTQPSASQEDARDREIERLRAELAFKEAEAKTLRETVKAQGTSQAQAAQAQAPAPAQVEEAKVEEVKVWTQDEVDDLIAEQDLQILRLPRELQAMIAQLPKVHLNVNAYLADKKPLLFNSYKAPNQEGAGEKVYHLLTPESTKQKIQPAHTEGYGFWTPGAITLAATNPPLGDWQDYLLSQTIHRVIPHR